MPQNVGTIDQALRIAAGLIILAVGLYYGSLWALLGTIPLATGLSRRCPAYALLNLASNRNQRGRLT